MIPVAAIFIHSVGLKIAAMLVAAMTQLAAMQPVCWWRFGRPGNSILCSVSLSMSKSDLDPLVIYKAYRGRWEIEVLFNLYKNIIDRSTLNVHNDYKVYATEFINFFSVIIATRMKKLFDETGLAKKYSFQQLMGYVAKLKKARLCEEKIGGHQPLLRISRAILTRSSGDRFGRGIVNKVKE